MHILSDQEAMQVVALGELAKEYGVSLTALERNGDPSKLSSILFFRLLAPDGVKKKVSIQKE